MLTYGSESPLESHACRSDPSKTTNCRLYIDWIRPFHFDRVRHNFVSLSRTDRHRDIQLGPGYFSRLLAIPVAMTNYLIFKPSPYTPDAQLEHEMIFHLMFNYPDAALLVHNCPGAKRHV
eukprot:805062-Amorphochlora_amoeboformis.AAC.1